MSSCARRSISSASNDGQSACKASEAFSFDRLAQAKSVVPSPCPVERLDDERESKIERAWPQRRRMKAARRRHRLAVTLRQNLKPRLVDEIFDQARIGDDEAEG